MANGKQSCCAKRSDVGDNRIHKIACGPNSDDYEWTEVLMPEDVYRRRLAACGSCVRLQDGETCAVCGCYVRVAAKLRTKSCPLPGGGPWRE